MDLWFAEFVRVFVYANTCFGHDYITFYALIKEKNSCGSERRPTEQRFFVRWKCAVPREGEKAGVLNGTEFMSFLTPFTCIFKFCFSSRAS